MSQSIDNRSNQKHLHLFDGNNHVRIQSPFNRLNNRSNSQSISGRSFDESSNQSDRSLVVHLHVTPSHESHQPIILVTSCSFQPLNQSISHLMNHSCNQHSQIDWSISLAANHRDLIIQTRAQPRESAESGNQYVVQTLPIHSSVSKWFNQSVAHRWLTLLFRLPAGQVEAESIMVTFLIDQQPTFSTHLYHHEDSEWFIGQRSDDRAVQKSITRTTKQEYSSFVGFGYYSVYDRLVDLLDQILSPPSYPHSIAQSVKIPTSQVDMQSIKPDSRAKQTNPTILQSNNQTQTIYNPFFRPFRDLSELRDLRRWPPKCKTVPLRSINNPLFDHSNNQSINQSEHNKSMRLIHCHDMSGGYTEDRFTQGRSINQPNGGSYHFQHWALVDVFVYFSHHRITVPPASWIDSAHKNGCLILGTVITEWEDGRLANIELLNLHDNQSNNQSDSRSIDGPSTTCSSSQTSSQSYAELLARLAAHCGFDGWLINIESDVSIDQIDQLEQFLRDLTSLCRRYLNPPATHQTSSQLKNQSNSLVLMYDSVTIAGKIKWQSQLNDQNKRWFDACDGLFTDYHWQVGSPAESAQAAANQTIIQSTEHPDHSESSSRSTNKEIAPVNVDRQRDVYTGIDVFGRGTYGGGHWDCAEALKVIKDSGTSAALFAPAWTFEGCGARDDAELWRELDRQFWWGTANQSIKMTDFKNMKPGLVEQANDSTNQPTDCSTSQLAPSDKWKWIHGGQGWSAIEDQQQGYCLISSHTRCERERLIELPRQPISRPIIIVQKYCGTGPSFDDSYELRVELLASDLSVLDTFMYSATATDRWVTVKHTFQQANEIVHRSAESSLHLLPRYLRWFEACQDAEGWYGHFGTKIAAGEIRIRDVQQPSIRDYKYPRRISLASVLPLYHTFGSGAGDSMWVRGEPFQRLPFGTRADEDLSDQPAPQGWFDMFEQSVQTIYHESIQRDEIVAHKSVQHPFERSVTSKASVDYSFAFDGGSSLSIEVGGQLFDQSIDIPVFVFDSSPIRQPLVCSFTVHSPTLSVALALTLDDGSVIVLPATHPFVTSTHSIAANEKIIEWMTYINTLSDLDGRSIIAIHARATATQPQDGCSEHRAYLGSIIISPQIAPSSRSIGQSINQLFSEPPVTSLTSLYIDRVDTVELQLHWKCSSDLIDRFEVLLDDVLIGWTKQLSYVLLTIPRGLTKRSIRVAIRCRFIDGSIQSLEEVLSAIIAPL